MFFVTFLDVGRLSANHTARCATNPTEGFVPFYDLDRALDVDPAELVGGDRREG